MKRLKSASFGVCAIGLLVGLLAKPVTSITRGLRYSLFDKACAQSSHAMIRLLLELGADPDGERDYQDYSRWFEAAPLTRPVSHPIQTNDPKTLGLLLAWGANPDVEPFPPEEENLLSMAIRRGSDEMVMLLVRAGVRDRVPGSASAIQYAAGLGKTNVVSILLNAGWMASDSKGSDPSRGSSGSVPCY